MTWTKLSHIQLTFTVADIKLVSFPYTDAMVITSHIDKWDITRVLVDNGSQAFDQLGYDIRHRKEATKPLYGFMGNIIEPVGTISLPVSFGSLKMQEHNL
jgi:hypothetical protein